MAEENNNPAPNTGENVESNPTPTSGGSNNKNGGLIATIIILSILLVVAIFLALFFGLRNNSSDDDTVAPDPEIVEPGPVEDPDDGNEGEPTHIHSTTDSGYLIEEYTDNDTPMGLVEYTCDECGLPYIETRELHLASDSWEEISEYSSNGEAKQRYSVGETKDITVLGYDLITEEPCEKTLGLRIIDFDHDELSEEDETYNNGTGKAGITFETSEMLFDSSWTETYEMNSDRDCPKGWPETDLRLRLQPSEDKEQLGYVPEHCAGDIYDTLPSDLTPYVKTVNKKSAINNGKTNDQECWEVVTSDDQFFVLSLMELYAPEGVEPTFEFYDMEGYEFYAQEGTQYEYYKRLVGDHSPAAAYGEPLQKHIQVYTEDGGFNDGRIITLAYPWWTRSVSLESENYLSLDSYGMMDEESPTDDEMGVSFAFCI